ncbi:MAG: DUF934 domain-containing protein [Alcaligenaceae bacterium]
MNSTQTSDTLCIFDLTGQRIAHVTTLTLVLDTDAIFNRSEAGTVTTYLKGLLATQDILPTAIGVRFQKFTDGRSYSIASRLREIGYAGELHALGDINQELVFLLRRVGFTHFHLPDPGTPTLAPEILEPFNGYYQAGSDGTKAQWQV